MRKRHGENKKLIGSSKPGKADRRYSNRVGIRQIVFFSALFLIMGFCSVLVSIFLPVPDAEDLKSTSVTKLLIKCFGSAHSTNVFAIF